MLDQSNIEMTVIIPSYNRGEYIGKTIESVLQQDVNFEYRIIIADDCSTDDTAHICQAFVNKFPLKISFLPSVQNYGLYSNCLRVYKELQTAYFTVLDADDFWINDHFLQDAYDFLENNPSYTIYGGNTVYFRNGEFAENVYIGDEQDYTTDSIIGFLSGAYRFGLTTASVYRNVFMGNKVPQIMLDAEGTLSGESYRADTDRNVIHLKYGKAYFNNIVYGAYRINEKGIYMNASKFHNLLLEARARLDYADFYEGKFKKAFYVQANNYFILANEQAEENISDIDWENYKYIRSRLDNYFYRKKFNKIKIIQQRKIKWLRTLERLF
jgi:glycosyltransferase involved in cell wall biosynthesis